MNLSETIIKIHSIATDKVGELEADEFISSMLIVILNDLKKNSELSPENLLNAFKHKLVLVEREQLDYELKRPKLSLIRN